MKNPSLDPIHESTWNAATARHLLNRAGFGIPRERVAALAAMSPERAVSALVDFDQTPSQFRPPEFIGYPTVTAGGLPTAMMDETQRQNMLQRINDERQLVRRLRGWWLQRMTETPRPLEEKLALFWHGHFATSAHKVKSSYANYHLNDTFRKYAAGSFKDLTMAVAQSPAMLRYLDNNRNVKGSPNENWARELMELFTMGQGHYTETDVRESARAFTGWSFRDEHFRIRKAQHDDGIKEFLGRRGNFDGYDIVDIIFDHPATSEFIVRKLWTWFAYERPEPEIIAELAADFRQGNYELRPLLRTMFLSQAFYSDRAVGTQIKSPVECVLQTAADLRLEHPPYQFMAGMAAQLGQDLFHPPNVKGWNGGRAWINAHTLLHRYNLPQKLVAASIVERLEPESDANPAMMRQNGRRIGHYVRQLLQAAPAQRARHYRLQLQHAPPEDRRTILLQALMEFAPPDTWRVQMVYEDLRYESAAECIDALAGRLLGRPLTERQRSQLAQILAPNQPSTLLPLRQENMLAALRLLMSLAEYQLT